MIIEIEGQQVEVDDSFMKLSPEQQNATVDEIAASLGPAKPAQQPQQTQLGADRAQANDAQVAEQTAAGRREAYDQKPWYQQAAQAADDEARLLASGISMGFGDKMAAGLNTIGTDRTYEDQLKIEREATQAARDRASSAALPTEIAGAVMTGSLAANSGATLAGRLGTANMTGIKGVLARAGIMAPEGALYGATDALGNDRDVTTGAVTGALAAPIGSVVGDTVSKVASKVLPAKSASTVPSLEKLHQAADDAYKASERAGVMIKPDVMQKVRANVQAKLAAFGYHPQNHPGVKVALDELDRIAQGNITLKGVDVARQVTRGGYTPTNPKQNAALEIIVSEIDDAVKGLNPKDVIMGNSKDGVKSLLKAREMWTRVRKNESFVDAVESAKLRAGSTYSGGNVENATRQELRRFVDPKIKTGQKNWTPDEAAAIKNIVTGTLGQNTLRLLGKIAPQGNGLNLLLHLGGASATAGATLPFAVGGMGAKYAADRGVRKAVEQLDELIRVGGSQAALQQAQATLRSLSQSQREAVARVVQMAITQSEVGQKQPAQ